MVRLALLAVLVAACLALAPAAEAVDLPVDLQSSTATAVGQVQAVAAGAVATATQAAPAATPQVNVDTTAPAVAAAPHPAQPPAQPSEYTTAAAVSVIDDGPRHTDGDAPVRSARFKQGHRHVGPSRAQGHGGAAVARPPVEAAAPTHAVRRARQAPGATSKERPPAPDRTPPTSGGGAASAPAAGLSLGGLALLAVVICLAGPRLGRRLLIPPAAPRPVAFVSLLERPG